MRWLHRGPSSHRDSRGPSWRSARQSRGPHPPPRASPASWAWRGWKASRPARPTARPTAWPRVRRAGVRNCETGVTLLLPSDRSRSVGTFPGVHPLNGECSLRCATRGSDRKIPVFGRVRLKARRCDESGPWSWDLNGNSRATRYFIVSDPFISFTWRGRTPPGWPAPWIACNQSETSCLRLTTFLLSYRAADHKYVGDHEKT